MLVYNDEIYDVKDFINFYTSCLKVDSYFHAV